MMPGSAICRIFLKLWDCASHGAGTDLYAFQDSFDDLTVWCIILWVVITPVRPKSKRLAIGSRRIPTRPSVSELTSMDFVSGL